MSSPSDPRLVTKTGCNVRVWRVANDTYSDGIYLHLDVDTRHAELKMTPDEAREIARLLLEQADKDEKEHTP